MIFISILTSILLFKVYHTIMTTIASISDYIQLTVLLFAVVGSWALIEDYQVVILMIANIITALIFYFRARRNNSI